ncbi:tail protein X [Aurantiacibacter suaedae]|uniref:tail protein X n=1 Tax=Aurantiacibacter suaedae TaxID=2545755 RepID=UPI0010F8B209|nr:tail protein X [Aurantiacibacter suaedae]
MAARHQARALQGETIDALCWRLLGRTSGVVEQVLELNRGLADGATTLAEGQLVTIPAIPESFTPERSIIQLWD